MKFIKGVLQSVFIQVLSTVFITILGIGTSSAINTVFCKTFLHNIAKKKYTPLRLKFFSDYCGFDRAFLSR